MFGPQQEGRELCSQQVQNDDASTVVFPFSLRNCESRMMRPRIQHKTWAEVLQTRAKKKRAGTKFRPCPPCRLAAGRSDCERGYFAVAVAPAALMKAKPCGAPNPVTLSQPCVTVSEESVPKVMMALSVASSGQLASVKVFWLYRKPSKMSADE